jgi:hypothetical protein
MKQNSGRQESFAPRALIEAALLLIVFVIAEWVWPVSDLLEEN